MSDCSVKAIFLATSLEAKQIFMPIYRVLIKKHPDILIYNAGPIVREIKDRNVVITANREMDANIIKDFNCGVICLSKDVDPNMAVVAIEKEAEKGNM